MYILIDIGGTNTRIAGTKDKQSFGEPFIFSTPEHFADWLAKASDIIIGIKGADSIETIVVGFPGVFSVDRSSIHVAPNLPAWNGVNLKERLADPFSANLILENDTALVGLGEAVYGSGKEYDIVAYITVSTGVNGVRITDGQIDRNKFGYEIGCQIVHDGKEIEYYIGGRSLASRFGIPSKENKNPELWKEVDYYTGILAANTTMYWSPAVIVFGGPVMNDIHLENVLQTAKTFAKRYETLPAFVKSSLGALGGLYGGLAIVQKIRPKDF
jgi:predicted NBD/HSP70 family sugar kinase